MGEMSGAGGPPAPPPPPSGAVPPPPPEPPVDPMTPVPVTPEPLIAPVADEDARLRRLLFFGLGLAALGIVAVIVAFLATRGSSPTPVAVASPSASASASPSPTATPTDTPTPTPTPTPPPTAKPTAVPLPNTPAQQAVLLFPPSGSECGGNGNYSACPVTPALVDAANRWRTAHNPSAPAPLCRCPVNYQTPVAQQDDTLLPAGYQGNPAMAAVSVSLTLPPSHQYTMVVIFARQNDGSWLAVDTYCDNPQNRLTSGNPQLCN